jgi:hypothetical protein
MNLLIFLNKFIDIFAYNQNISAKSIKAGFLFPVLGSWLIPDS